MKLLTLMALSGTLIAATATNTAEAASERPTKASISQLKKGVNWHRQQTWYWQDIRLTPRTKTVFSERTTQSRSYLRWLVKKWSARRIIAKYNAHNVPHYKEWICIHGHEGAWNDPNAPYYGGLQMDMSFQRSYGWNALKRWGTADNWHPLTQMWVAERAFASGRGFYPWPNTARYCGLI